jgi:hypothetical protein
LGHTYINSEGGLANFADSVLTVAVDGINAYFMANDTLIHTQPFAMGDQRWHGRVAHGSNNSVWNIQFGAYGDQRRSSKFGTNGRVTDPTAYNTQQLLAPSSTTNLAPTYTANGAGWTVNLPAHLRKIAGISGAVPLSYGASSGYVGASVGWAAYTLDPNLSGNASPTVYYTTNPDDMLQAGAYEIARGFSPAQGTSDPPPPGTGGGGGTYGPRTLNQY